MEKLKGCKYEMVPTCFPASLPNTCEKSPKMKAQRIPNCNRSFIRKGLKENKRVDGRGCADFRDVAINFGSDFGSCVVSLGNTKVLSSISADIVEPKPAKPCEGLLTIFVDLSPMASPSFEAYKVSDKGVEVIRIIERAIRDSKCVDLESLCLVAHEKVWALRVEVIVLNNEGNLIECCSTAALSSLSHYRRPEVTVNEENVTIHSFEDKHPIPLTVFHYPFCTSFVFYPPNKIVVDPSELEELLCAGYLVVSANSFREITMLHISGESRVDKGQVLKCCNLAIERSKQLTSVVKEALKRDTIERNQDDSDTSFVAKLKSKTFILSSFPEKPKNVEVDEGEEMDEEIIDFEPSARSKMFRFGPQLAEVGGGGPDAWNQEEKLDESSEEDANVGHVDDIVYNQGSRKNPRLTKDASSSDEEVVILQRREFEA